MKNYQMQSNLYSNRLYNILNKNKIYFIYIPLIIYWIALFIATTIPIDKIPQIFNAQDKLEHFIAYFVLAVLINFCYSIQKRFPKLSSNAVLFTLVTILLYGALDEIHQLLIPGRYCDFYDWCADSIGGFAGITLVYFLLRVGYRNNTEQTIS